MRVSNTGCGFIFFCILLLTIAGCARPKAIPKPKPEIEKPLAVGKRILLVVPQSHFSGLEFDGLQTFFTNQGAELFLTAPRGTTASSTEGHILPTDIALELAHADHYDAVVFVGGKGASSLFQNEDALRLAREAAEQDKVLGAIGTATLTLGLAGVLKGKTATAPPRLAGSFTDVAQCTYKNQPVVADENIITAGKPDAVERFAKNIAKRL